MKQTSPSPSDKPHTHRVCVCVVGGIGGGCCKAMLLLDNRHSFAVSRTGMSPSAVSLCVVLHTRIFLFSFFMLSPSPLFFNDVVVDYVVEVGVGGGPLLKDPVGGFA